ncbi:MAG TPA: carboxymuconolactone decarboxylase family protein [Methanomicrobia archaeon]|nr:YurZ protein [Candidatus Alkanophaga volatiphilum]HDO63539.1 carboxymuconolactone decarboxylase family protein [Methanomicrobia archaeon]HEX59132.1 carboxymuconolactone decarboxylase family protein [Methanomicrobia archaeon]
MSEELFERAKKLLGEPERMVSLIFEAAEGMLGTVPFILKEMARRPEVMIPDVIGDFFALRPKALDAKTAELVALAAAAALRAEECISVHIDAALKCGATEEEIFDVLMISGIMGKTAILATALRKLKEKREK